MTNAGWFSRHWRTLLLSLLLAAVVASAYALLTIGDTGQTKEKVVTWQPWSLAAVEAARADGRPVFIEFNANWSAITQINKPTLRSEEISKLMLEKNVAVFFADFTTKDPKIAAELKKLGRNGVPAYPLYSPGSNVEQFMPNNLFNKKAEFVAALEALPDPN